MIKDNTLVCPVCNSRDVRELFETKSLAVIRHLSSLNNRNTKELIRQKIEALWKADHASYFRCRECTFEFAHPFVAADPGFYDLVYHSEIQYPADKWEYLITSGSVQKFIHDFPISPRLLEIGAGNGSFLKLVAAIIPMGDIFATEYSGSGAKSISQMGITCYQYDLQQISEAHLHGKISIVCMFQVLEHMTNLHELFEKLRILTLPGSRFYISVPNNHHRQFFDRFNRHYDLPPVHVGRYNDLCMVRLAEAHGWKLLQHAIQPTGYKERILKFIFSEYAAGQSVFDPEKVKLRVLRLLLRYGMLTLLVVFHLRIVIGLRDPKLGIAQWFELERANN